MIANDWAGQFVHVIILRVFMQHPHLPVLLEEVNKAFSGISLTHFFDGTVGGGGHAEAILSTHPEISCYLAIDRDPIALELARQRLAPFAAKTHFVRGNFCDFNLHLKQHGLTAIDGMLLDLGISSMQIDTAERGFSFMRDGPLDMRMDPDQLLTAEQIVNRWSERDLGELFRDLGEEKSWRVAARTIVLARKKAKITTTRQLVELLAPLLYRGKRGIHPLTLVFQALRIAVNSELEAIGQTLSNGMASLRAGGRLAVISFHSLEDRIVKQTFREAAVHHKRAVTPPLVKLLTKKPWAAGDEEIRRNPRCRSAKLRVVERV